MFVTVAEAAALVVLLVFSVVPTEDVLVAPGADEAAGADVPAAAPGRHCE